VGELCLVGSVERFSPWRVGREVKPALIGLFESRGWKVDREAGSMEMRLICARIILKTYVKSCLEARKAEVYLYIH
jgi:hypothetical protein